MCRGEKATLITVGAPDADILAAAIEILRKRIAAGTATFWIKVKALRGEPANEGANILADKVYFRSEGRQRVANRAVFTCKKPCCKAGQVTYQDCHSTLSKSVRDTV